MALLSDRDSFDRLTMQRIIFADAIGKLVSRVQPAPTQRAIERYAQWLAYDDNTLLDVCFVDVPTEDWQEIIDCVNGMWVESRP
jgi:hypothetical protein